KSHPALLTKFTFDEDGEIIQSYDPSMMPEITVEKISEFDLNILKDNLVQPFKMIDSRLFRCRVFETEKAAYLFFDVHHTVFDGTSFKVLMNGIAQSYMGMPMPKDYYYLTLKKREESALTPFYEESRKYFEERYDGDDWISFPPVDHQTRENEFGQLACEMGITSAELSVIEKRFKVSRNEFFITVAALAVSLFAGKPKVKLSWIYNGREDVKMMNTIGLLFRDLPVAFCFDKNQNIADIFADAHEQVQKAIEHSCYPYVENNSLAVEDNVAYDCISGIFVTQATLTVLRSKRLRFVKITPRRKVCLILRFRTVIWSFVCRLTMHRAAMSETQWSVSVCCLCVLPQCRSMRTVRSTSRLRACATKYRRIIRFSVKLYLCFQKGRKIKMSLNIEK
ncbi:MAG: condensation domain-containing protein, partial [Oscillospiraceae bacterium]|nr:condensation domain-containing protein [Oscillospiraceae bacterium]